MTPIDSPVTWEEFKKAGQGMFSRLDANKDGVLTPAEFAALMPRAVSAHLSGTGGPMAGAPTGEKGSNVYMGFRNKRGEREGYGVMKGKDGTIYTGQWVSSRREGHGTLFFDGGVFEGQWSRGNAHGDGMVHFKNGDTFKGCYVDNQKNGIGTYSWKDGAEERGGYVDGKKHEWHRWRKADDEWDILYDQGNVTAARRAQEGAAHGTARPEAIPTNLPQPETRVPRREIIQTRTPATPEDPDDNTPRIAKQERPATPRQEQGLTPRQTQLAAPRQVNTRSKSPAPAGGRPGYPSGPVYENADAPVGLPRTAPGAARARTPTRGLSPRGPASTASKPTAAASPR